MEITAIFEDVDFAECALVRLREQGLAPLGYKIKATRPLARPSDGGALPQSGFYNSFINGMPMPLNRERAWNAAGTRAASKEVQLSVFVERDLSGRTYHSLISNHGRKVTYN